MTQPTEEEVESDRSFDIDVRAAGGRVPHALAIVSSGAARVALWAVLYGIFYLIAVGVMRLVNWWGNFALGH